MQQYEQIVEDILTILTADIDPSDDALRDTDTRYADAVNEVNERLVTCDKLLHKGHRAEAIQACEREPSLLDAVAVLDFPEASQWSDYVRQFGLAGPPALRSEIAIELNDAYTMNSELGESLRKHRLLALARAPLEPRLKVLRQIARQDAGNPIWQDDVRSWEQIRHTQLPLELERAAARNDLGTIAQLQQEVRSKDWLVRPPEAIARRIAESHGAVRAKQARRQLEALEKQLTEAYADYDVQRARKIRQQWESLAAIGITRQDDPLLEMVTPALDWLAEQDQQDQEQQDYDVALADLQAALDAGAPRGELERLAHAVMHFEQGLPETLEQRLQARFNRLDNAVRRKTVLILTATVMSLLLIAGLIFWTVYAIRRGGQLAGHVENATQLVDERRLPEAASYLDQLKTNDLAFYQTAEIQNLAKALETASQEEQARHDRLTQSLQDARGDGQTWDGYGDARRSLRTADELVAKAPSHLQDAEAKEVDVARNEVEKRHDELQREFDEKWQGDFAAWRQLYDQRQRGDLDELSQLISEGETLQKRPYVQSMVRNEIRPLLESLEKEYRAAIDSQTESELLQRIAEAVGDRSKYQRRLLDYVDKFSHKARSADLTQVSENELVHWDGIEKWNALIDRWSTLNLNGISASKARELIKEAESLMEQHPGFPAASAIRQILEFLKPIQSREPEDGQQLADSLVPDLGVAPVKDFLMVLHEPAEGPPVRYYFTGQAPTLSSRSAKLEYLIQNRTTETRQVEILRDEIGNPPVEKSFDWSSPQQLFYDSLAQRMRKLNDQNWESTFFEIIRDLYADPLMEPILKVELLGRVLDTACEGSYPVRRGFGRWREEIQQSQLDVDVDWVDPQNANASRTRTAAEHLLKDLGGLEVASVEAGRAWREMLAPRAWTYYIWVGCLLKDSQQNWTCATIGNIAGLSGQLVVIHGAAGAAPTFTTVGRLDNGRATLSLLGTQVEGRPVFVVRQK